MAWLHATSAPLPRGRAAAANTAANPRRPASESIFIQEPAQPLFDGERLRVVPKFKY